MFSWTVLAMSHILDKLDGDEHIVLDTHTEGYDEQTGRHLIRLI